MIELVWIRIKDGADPIEVLERAHAAMGDDGHIIALKPIDDTVRTAGEVVYYRIKDGKITQS